MLDDWWRLIQFSWLLAAPALDEQSDAALTLMGVGLAVMITIGIVMAVVAIGAGCRDLTYLVGAPRLRAYRTRSQPPGARFLRFTARPRAPGAVLV